MSRMKEFTEHDTKKTTVHYRNTNTNTDRALGPQHNTMNGIITGLVINIMR